MATTDLLQDLGTELASRREDLLRFDRYYEDGFVDALDVPSRARPELAKIIRSAVTNWLRLTIETTAERLIVDGFRLSGSTSTDSVLWDYWQANKLDGAQMAHNVETLKSGYSYVGVWEGDEEGAPPVIRPESPWSVHVAYDSDDPTKATSAVKLTKSGLGYLYLPEVVTVNEWNEHARKWRVRDVFENPLGEIPFVKFRANPRVDGGTSSDLAVAIPIQDRITRTTIERLIAAYFSAFRQRWATGLVLDVDENGDPIAPFNAAADRLWISDEEGTKFGEFAEATLTNYISAVEADVQHLAAVTRTPPHYLLGQMTNLSAEALKAAETGLSRKVSERQQTFGESWEEVMRLAAKAAGNEALADDSKIETVWRNTESSSEAQIVDAAMKLVALDIPKEVLWERIGASPTEITRWRRMATGDALRAGLANPVVNDAAADLEAAEEETQP